MAAVVVQFVFYFDMGFHLSQSHSVSVRTQEPRSHYGRADFAAPFGVYGSFGTGAGHFILGLLVWTALFPIDDESANVSSFFKTYLAAPIVGIFYVSYKIIFKTKIVRTRDGLGYRNKVSRSRNA